jgi:hypothetical protein
MKCKKAETERLIYAGIFLFALSIRLVGLGNSPLSDHEAVSAVEALSIARADPIGMGAQAGYVGLSALTFFLLEASVFLARLWPALIGSLIVFLPYLWREKIGYQASVILAAGLALDPLLLAGSRQAGSPIIALIGLLLGISLLYRGKAWVAGIFFAVGMLGGESFWLGMVILTLTWGVGRFLKLASFPVTMPEKLNTKELIVSFLAALLIIASSFGLYPAGLSGIMTGFIAFTERFYLPSGILFWQPLLALLAYQLLPFILGVWAGVKAWRGPDGENRDLSLWVVMGLLLIMIIPGRQILDLLWVVVPLWALAVKVFLAFISVPEKKKTSLWALGLFTCIMLGYISMNLKSLAGPNLLTANASGYLIAIGTGILLLILTVVLIGLGWQFKFAWRGLVLGSCAFGLLLMLSSSFRIIRVPDQASSELWRLGKEIPLSDLSVDIMSDLVDRYVGEQSGAAVAVINLPDPDLAWVLRGFDTVKFYTHLPEEQQPEFVLTEMEEIPQLTTSYRGQALTWYRWPDWKGMSFLDHLRWLVNRRVSYTEAEVILWVRSDLFLDRMTD